MNVKQVADLVKEIMVVYPQVAREMTVDELFRVYKKYLLDQDFDKVSANLEKHIKTSEYPPKISQLIAKVEDEKYNIPSVEETRAYMESLKPAKRVSKERLAELAKEAGVDVSFRN